MLVTGREMQESEARAFAAGAKATGLMEQAGLGIARATRQFFPEPGTLVLYLGSGNNAGDALVAGQELARHGWRVLARLSVPPEQLKPLPRAHLAALPGMPHLPGPPAEATGPLVLFDGLLGIGSRGELRPPLRSLAAEMNALRRHGHARTVAMDLPSGLDADTGVPGADAVVADLTVTIGFVKAGLVSDAAVNHVGRLALVPLPALTATAADSAELLTPDRLSSWLERRPFDFHKGQAGRVGVLAGSPGFWGAAELACRGALRSGAGLVSLLAKPEACAVLAARLPAEVMVRQVTDYREALDLRFDALAIGPGLGLASAAEYLPVIRDAPCPAVVDADAITALARQPEMLTAARGHRLLTPHPGEMARLDPRPQPCPRREQAEAWATRAPGHTLLLKGARTVMARAGHATRFNSTGHPGMAAGGMGDVLTGVCAGWLAQGQSPEQAAGLGAWLCGRAAELSALEQAEASVLPGDVLACLGRALRELQTPGSTF